MKRPKNSLSSQVNKFTDELIKAGPKRLCEFRSGEDNEDLVEGVIEKLADELIAAGPSKMCEFLARDTSKTEQSRGISLIEKLSDEMIAGGPGKLRKFLSSPEIAMLCQPPQTPERRKLYELAKARSLHALGDCLRRLAEYDKSMERGDGQPEGSPDARRGTHK